VKVVALGKYALGVETIAVAAAKAPVLPVVLALPVVHV
jgi:hypothetical protein